MSVHVGYIFKNAIILKTGLRYHGETDPSLPEQSLDCQPLSSLIEPIEVLREETRIVATTHSARATTVRAGQTCATAKPSPSPDFRQVLLIYLGRALEAG